MPKRLVALPREPAQSALDIVSYGRRGPGASGGLTSEQIEQVARTVRRTPEVVVKVSGGARDAGGVRAHADYIGRHGKLGVENDDGRLLLGRDAGAQLVDDWNLELSRGQYRPPPSAGSGDNRPKVVHNIVLSMPGRTPPDALLEAARTFAREHFALQYRYAMALHTDQAHPHVHLIVKAEHEFEPGKRLYIRKETLRQWREDFAACLREQGLEANATPAALRGRPRTAWKDPIYRRLRARGSEGSSDTSSKSTTGSTFVRRKVERVAALLKEGRLPVEPGYGDLWATRQAVEKDWRETAEVLRRQGETRLAEEVKRYLASMAPVRTDDMKIAAGLLARIRAARHPRQREAGAPDVTPDAPPSGRAARAP